MKTSLQRAALGAVCLLMMQSLAIAVPLLQPGDPILAIDIDPPAPIPASSSPGNEQAPLALDQDSATKYLNFGENNSGLIFKPAAASIVRSMILTTANDAVPRDPASYRLWGTNDNLDIPSLNHTQGLAGKWTLISEGAVTLSDDRFVASDPIVFANPTAVLDDFDNDGDTDGADFLVWQRNVGAAGSGTKALGDANGDANIDGDDLNVWRGQFGNAKGGLGQSFSTYRLSFPTVKDALAANSMQIANIDLFTSNNGTGTSIVSATDTVAAIDFNSPGAAALQSSSPANEQAPLAIDGDTLTKYLNFGENNSGFIVTPAVGPSKVTSFVITSANDAVARDPATWALFGTNDTVVSADHSRGQGESWTLIAEGTVDLPIDRFLEAPEVSFANTVSYKSYRMIFPTVKDAAGANSMQFSEIQFNGTIGTVAVVSAVPEPGSATLALLGMLFAARSRSALRRRSCN